MKQILTFLLFICITFYSCSYECSNATVNFSLVSFQPNETDTIVVRKFTKMSNFTTLLDTFSLNQSNSSYQNTNDTLEVWHPYGTDNGLLSKYDYEIYLTSINRTYQISEIREDFRSINQGLSCNKLGCMNFFKSYKMNGELINVNSIFTLYFVK